MSNSSRISFVVYLLGATIFAMTTAEFMVAGMMPSLAAALDVSVGEVGFLISYYALGMTIGGPILTALLLALGLPHKPSLLWLLVLYIAGGVLSAVANSYDMMVVGRIIMGVASSACFGVSLTICAGLVAPEARGRAASFVLGGLMFAPVFGVPITAIIEQHYGWRASFWSVAVLAMLCTLVVAWRVPRAENHESVSLSAEFRSLWNARLWAAYITSALIIGAAFSAFSYFTPIFTEITGFSAGIIPLLLMIYGISNVVGNMVVGRLADRYTMPVLAVGLALLAAALATFALCSQSCDQHYCFHRHWFNRCCIEPGHGRSCDAHRVAGHAG